jgi:ankyrin repeat protein
MRSLIEKHIDVNQKTNKNMAPLHIAIKAKNYDEVKLLIDSGADVDLFGDDFIPRTPLMFAAQEGDRQIVELLLECGADPNIRIHDKNNVLYYAKGHLDIFDLFIKRNVDYKIINQYDESLLSIAANMEQDFQPSPLALNLAKYLLDLGIPPDGLSGERSYPIVCAAYASNIEVIKLLIANKADINKADRFNCTALFAALDRGNVEIVKLLVENGADVNLKARTLHFEQDKSPLEFIQEKLNNYCDDETKSAYQTAIKLLNEHGAIPAH